MTTKILKAVEVDFTKLGFLRPNYTKDTIVLPIFYENNGKSAFLVQIPSLILNNSYQGKGYIILPLNGKNTSTTKAANNFFKTLDKVVVEKVKKIITDLRTSGKITSADISYRAVVNELEGDNNDIYKNGLIRYRLDFPDIQVYDDKKNIIAADNFQKVFTKGVFVKSIIEVTSLIINTKTGNISLFIKPLQLRIQDETVNKVDLKSYSFFDDDSENELDESKNDIKDATLNTQTDCLESEKREVKRQIKVESKPIELRTVLKQAESEKQKTLNPLAAATAMPIPAPIPAPVVKNDELSDDGDDLLNNVVDINSDTDNMDDNEIKNYFESISEVAAKRSKSTNK
jgi:hypothetical protein